MFFVSGTRLIESAHLISKFLLRDCIQEEYKDPESDGAVAEPFWENRISMIPQDQVVLRLS